MFVFKTGVVKRTLEYSYWYYKMPIINNGMLRNSGMKNRMENETKLIQIFR